MGKKRNFSKGSKPKDKSSSNDTMGKNKNNNNKNSDKKYNPFEIHINRVKHSVVGQKSKDDRGLPGVSRAKALKKREKTLLQEYKQRHKSNVFIDKRIGEFNKTMDPEKKISLRIAAEKKKQFNRKSLFNLNEDEELTHGGMSLMDVNMKEKFNLSDEDDDDDMLDADFVKEQHFGGGDFLKKRVDENEVNEENKFKSRKEWIDDIIAESKKKKAESKREKEQQYEAVSKLDSELQSFMHLMIGQKLTDEDKDKAKKENEFRDYDSLVKELGFDRTGKAKATQKLKTPEEIIKEEKDRLERLESERVMRMMGKEKTKQSERSADDLDDGFALGGEEKFHLSYKDGKMLTNINEENEKDDKNEEIEEEDEENEEEEEEEEEEEDNDENEEEEDNDDNEDDDNESDKYSDILEGSDSENEENEKEENTEATNEKMKKGEAKIMKKDIERKKEMMEAAKKEIPYTFEVPQDYEGFWSLLENRSPQEVGLIIERMITCNHMSLGSTNKQKCNDIFAYLLQTIHVLSDIDGESLMPGVSGMIYIDIIIPHLYTISQMSSEDSAKALLQVIQEMYEDCAKLKFKRYPTANTFVFLKISGMLFPSSDFIHPVMTPVISFLTQLLGQAKINNERDVNASLFTANLLMEYISVSKRFIPELTNVLNGLLFMAIQDQNKKHLPLTHPFKYFGPASHLLVLKNKLKKFQESKLKFSSLNCKENNLSDQFKINVMCKVLKSLTAVCQNWIELKSIRAIMQPTIKLIGELKIDYYPGIVKDYIEKLKTEIGKLPRQGPPLVKQDKKPMAIRMYEPAIEKVIEGVKKRFGTKEYQEKQKLQHKVKRERKGARRELQRDTAFKARQQLADALQNDAIRKRKLGQIMSGLQIQEGEFKKTKKKK